MRKMENLYAKLMAAHSRFLRELCESHALNTMELYCEYGYCKGILDASDEMPDINGDAARHWEMGHTVETMRQALEALEKFEAHTQHASRSCSTSRSERKPEE